LYGTRETIGADASDTSDQEKLAEAQVLDEMFRSEGINVDDIADQTILKLAHEIFGDNSALVKAAAEGEMCSKCEKSMKDCSCPKEEKAAPPPFAKKEAAAVAAPAAAADETFEEKFAQADKLGRVMAHAFVHENSEIQKRAAEMCPKCEKAKGECSCPKEKEAGAQPSAFDVLAENRALAMLKEAGITPGESQEQTEEAKLAAAVEARAVEMLTEAGYIK